MQFTARCASSLLLLVCLCVPGGAQTKPAAPSNDAGKAPAKEKLPTVDAQKLKELMPAEVAGLKRASQDGQNQKLGSSSMSVAKAVYSNHTQKEVEAAAEANPDAPPPPNVQVSIIDYAGTEGGTDVAAAWAKTEVKTENDDGYQKTLKVGGFPAMEIWDKQGKSGQLQVFVADRFVVAVNTLSLPAEKMQEVAKSMQLEKLAALK